MEHFTASMHQEYKSKGIHFQVQSPLFVTTKLAKIRKPSVTVPTPKAFAVSSVRAMGYESQTSPFWAHALQLAAMAALPTFLLDKVSGLVVRLLGVSAFCCVCESRVL